ncbi:cysteinyl leukotriene receptor 1-like [Paramacrobiotus metropolitanus]|uniref:cysteinyl leukotriene receptor 1-like n=1 Tax=Paramacrobiotus metropolitanus TaxID=2943436 RepID=UPI002445A557|nr:cysteinyl leukotriene receptor 1-like [Paramacrobiotus metropolitanus]
MLVLQFLPQTHVTSFTIYLIVIATGNIVIMVVMRPIGVMNSFTGIWPGGRPLCAAYTYAQFVVSMIPVLLHVLIAVNRLWAVTYPVHYRVRHNKKVALLLCLGVMVYVHMVHFPIFLLEFYYFGPAGKQTGCQPGEGGIIQWRRADFIIHRIVPLFTILTIYIYVIIKRWLNRRIIAHQPETHPSADADTPNADTAGRKSISRLNRRQQDGMGIRRRTVKPFIVLALTSINVIVCWVPADTDWALLYLNMRPPAWAHTLTGTLYSLQMVFDPLMWLFSVR